MLTAEENERLTRIGPGTPMGDLLRRYWQPIAAASQLDEYPIKEIKVLGESLVLYRDRGGDLGLIADRCAHRRVRLVYGIPEPEGLRCPYHGWLYDKTGQCLEMPCEALDSTFPERVKMTAYPVEELGGLIFTYMGPAPAPLLPRYDLFAWDNVLRDIGFQVVPCNWLQMMENNVDLTHLKWLHGYFSNHVLANQLGRPDLARVNWDPDAGQIIHDLYLFENGLIKRTRRRSDPPYKDESEGGGQGFVFPNIERVMTNFQYRVPVDDTHTLQIYYSAYPQPRGEVVHQDRIPWYDVPLPFDDAGTPIWDLLDNNGGQDDLVLAGQGDIADRTQERLGESDMGIIFYRELLKRQLAIVEDGGDPMNIVRDPDKNVCIDIPWGGADDPWATMKTAMRRVNAAWKFSPIVREMVIKHLGPEALEGPVH